MFCKFVHFQGVFSSYSFDFTIARIFARDSRQQYHFMHKCNSTLNTLSSIANQNAGLPLAMRFYCLLYGWENYFIVIGWEQANWSLILNWDFYSTEFGAVRLCLMRNATSECTEVMEFQWNILFILPGHNTKRV